MTVSDPGAGQQQPVCHPHVKGDLVEVASPVGNWFATVLAKYADGYDVEDANGHSAWIPCTRLRPAPSSAPPARDSGRDEAREAARDAIGQLLSEWTASQRWWLKASEADRESYREDADAVLDLPAVRRLLDGAR